MGKFTFEQTGIEGLVVVKPTVYGDDRGYFMETYNAREFKENGIDVDFVQDNQSRSRKGVLRGLHMQVNNPQGKLVRATVGEVFDVAVDVRRNSPTFGRWYGVKLSQENKYQFYIPEGFLHGFMALTDVVEFVYKCTRLYDPTDEAGVRFDDPEIGIEWPKIDIEPIMSPKDTVLPSFSDCMKKLGY